MTNSAAPVAPIQFQNLNWLMLFVVGALITFGVIMVASSSVDYAAEKYGSSIYIIQKQAAFLLLGIFLAGLASMMDSKIWQESGFIFLAVGLACLVLVLVPGIGKEVNGARRWIPLGIVQMQTSEVAKLCFIVFFASYLSRRNEYVRSLWSSFFFMCGIIGFVVLLLLAEPDFGSAVVLSFTLSAMMFVAGVPLWRFFMMAAAGVVGLVFIAVLSPYRWERLVTFTDPFARKFDSGYQLVQSLLAFGRGEVYGVGLGNSVQKQLFLPEAHTDFIFSVYVEETGFIGAIALILLVLLLLFVIFKTAVQAINKKRYYGGFFCIGVGTMFTTQAFINMGVASGLLPTKGLTFPFISYGGSSLLMSCLLMGMVFRIDWELRNES